jgi:hypothetical protein
MKAMGTMMILMIHQWIWMDLDGFGWIWGILRFWTSPEGIFLSFLCKTAKDNSNLAYIIFLFQNQTLTGW